MRENIGIDKNEKDLGNDDVLQNISAGVSQFWMGLIIVMSALIGVWGFLCLVSGLSGGGFAAMARGWLAAIGF
jgi:hypothetical protein